MRNEDVARAWANGHAASTASLRTDGVTLWSYALIIGVTEHSVVGVLDVYHNVALDYTSPDNYISQTMSCHTCLAKRYADKVRSPL